MKNPKQLPWIIEGYKAFAQQGIIGLEGESIARKLNKNKSSFYHYFGDEDKFRDALLDHHIQQALQLATEALDCQHIKPDVPDLFIRHKTDIFFHQQLRMNREKPEYKNCYEKAFKIVEKAIIEKWTDYLSLENQPLFALTFLNLIAENFLLRITEQTYNYQWLDNYLVEIQSIISGLYTKPA